jgi:putative hydrolase of the HAD superfamily
MIKAIIFDWGGVLIDNPVDGIISYCANLLNVETKLLKKTYSQYETIFQKGQISEKDLWKKICIKLNIKNPVAKSLWKTAVKQVFKDRAEIYNLILCLKKQGYKIALLSNTEKPTMEYFFEQGYEKYFDQTIFSCIEHAVKPEKKIYNIALNKLKVNAYETIFIDDKPEYVKAAKIVGINGIVFKTYKQLLKELKFFSINV